MPLSGSLATARALAVNLEEEVPGEVIGRPGFL